MGIRTGHGTGRGVPRIEVMPADELPQGKPAPIATPIVRTEHGHPTRGEAAKELGRLGGLAKAESRQMRQLMGLRELPDDHPYQPYMRMAREWRDAHVSELARTVGGGVCGPGPMSIVSTAALQLGASRYLGDRGAEQGDAKTLLEASRLADASRQNLLAAHELCAREATARDRAAPADVHAAVFERLGRSAHRPEDDQ